MTLPQSVGVIFGSNIGTTVTSWIVAAVGVSVNVKALALPMVGLGAILRLTGGETRRKHLGDALTGFGIFFLGIETLQATFQGLDRIVDLAAYNIGGVGGVLLFVAVGATLTLLMQSSSAAMALVLTAAMSGIVTLESAAAATIGTNIGTTSTALFSVIGATYNAKKVAAAHILFNLGTGLVALLTIPLLLKGVNLLASLSPDYDTATTLALFHTVFNILGVLLFLPFTHPANRLPRPAHRAGADRNGQAPIPGQQPAWPPRPWPWTPCSWSWAGWAKWSGTPAGRPWPPASAIRISSRTGWPWKP